MFNNYTVEVKIKTHLQSRNKVVEATATWHKILTFNLKSFYRRRTIIEIENVFIIYWNKIQSLNYDLG